jgi:metallophosphoesterase superfamily enzyme
MSIGQRHVFSWLHLSDLHFGHGDTSYQWDQKSVLTALSDDIDGALSSWPELPRPQAIIITGDIGFSGNALTSSEYAEAAEFLNRLLGLLDIPRQSVYMVPGNHDVQRKVQSG